MHGNDRLKHLIFWNGGSSILACDMLSGVDEYNQV
jgi:hypothetical protein